MTTTTTTLTEAQHEALTHIRAHVARDGDRYSADLCAAALSADSLAPLAGSWVEDVILSPEDYRE